MKHKLLLLSAIVPFTAVAAGAGSQSATVDQQQLQNAIPATQLIGQTVQTSDGRDFGEIQTIAFKQDGSVAYYEIEPDMETYEQASTEEQGGAETGAMTAGAEGEQEYAGSGVSANDAAAQDSEDQSADDNSIRVQAEDIRIEQGGEVVSINMDGQSIQDQGVSMSTSGSESEIEADELIGMDVDLSDKESFGAVEDIMLNEQGDKAVALVVDNWDGTNKERRAMQVDLESANSEEGVIRYDVSSDQLGEDGNFDLDKYTDDM